MKNPDNSKIINITKITRNTKNTKSREEGFIQQKIKISEKKENIIEVASKSTKKFYFTNKFIEVLKQMTLETEVPHVIAIESCKFG
ncbi:MAG: hypothetical protein ACTSRZ_10150 [Promethearchaeota archaeon]